MPTRRTKDKKVVIQSFRYTSIVDFFCRCDAEIAGHISTAVATDENDVGECSGCRKGWTHECPSDQSQSEAPEPKVKRIRTKGGGREMKR